MARREGRWPMWQLEGGTARGARAGGCQGASVSVRAEAGRRSEGGHQGRYAQFGAMRAARRRSDVCGTEAERCVRCRGW